MALPDFQRGYVWNREQIPMDCELWKMENYPDLLKERRRLLAAEANRRFEERLHGETALLDTPADAIEPDSPAVPTPVLISASIGGIVTDSEEREIEAINDWLEKEGLPRGQVSFELTDEPTGAVRAVLDLAWPNGLQIGLSAPVAVLLNEPPEVLEAASAAGYRCFTAPESFRTYVVDAELLGGAVEAAWRISGRLSEWLAKDVEFYCRVSSNTRWKEHRYVYRHLSGIGIKKWSCRLAGRSGEA